MKNFIKNTVYMFMFMMFLFGVNLVFELNGDGIDVIMVEPLYTRVTVILFVSMIMGLYMLLFDFTNARYERKLLKNLNDFARGFTNISNKRGALNVEYQRIYTHYDHPTVSDQPDMYNYLLTCIRYTKTCLKTASLFKQFTSKLEYFKMFNRLNSMLDILIKYDRESYLSWYQTKEDAK